jgi:hypothetical protein
MMTDNKTIADAKAKIDAARVEYEKASRKASRIINAQSKRIKTELEKEPITLASALEPYLAGDHAIENETGHKFLQDLTWTGAWKGSGLQASGGYWTETMQNQVKVAIGATFSDEKLHKLAQLIKNEVLPVIRRGALKRFPEAKVIDIFDDDLSEHYSMVLITFDDELFYIINQRGYNNANLESKKFSGSLFDCLTYIRGHYSYN